LVPSIKLNYLSSVVESSLATKAYPLGGWTVLAVA
jgi:hypothetical protein